MCTPRVHGRFAAFRASEAEKKGRLRAVGGGTWTPGGGGGGLVFRNTSNGSVMTRCQWISAQPRLLRLPGYG